MAAHPFGGGSPSLKQALDRFQELGCQLKQIADVKLVATKGPVRIRYLHNPANGKFVYVQDFPEDQPIGWALLRNWERVLDLEYD